jgi:hypothetical protein
LLLLRFWILSMDKFFFNLLIDHFDLSSSIYLLFTCLFKLTRNIRQPDLISAVTMSIWISIWRYSQKLLAFLWILNYFVVFIKIPVISINSDWETVKYGIYWTLDFLGYFHLWNVYFLKELQYTGSLVRVRLPWSFSYVFLTDQILF